MATPDPPQSRRPLIVVATRLEAWAVRRRLPGAHVFRCGVGVRRLPPSQTPAIISCGLVAGLKPTSSPGTVVIATAVSRAGANEVPCDPELSEKLALACERSDLAAIRGPLVTLPRLVLGAEREKWAAAGFEAADMESALLAAPGRRLAVVRVILDTPQRELTALSAWVVMAAPRFALRAATIAAESFFR